MSLKADAIILTSSNFKKFLLSVRMYVKFWEIGGEIFFEVSPDLVIKVV